MSRTTLLTPARPRALQAGKPTHTLNVPYPSQISVDLCPQKKLLCLMDTITIPYMTVSASRRSVSSQVWSLGLVSSHVSDGHIFHPTRDMHQNVLMFFLQCLLQVHLFLRSLKQLLTFRPLLRLLGELFLIRPTISIVPKPPHLPFSLAVSLSVFAAAIGSLSCATYSTFCQLHFMFMA